MGDLTRQKQPPGKGRKIRPKMAQNALKMADFSTQSAICEIAGALGDDQNPPDSNGILAQKRRIK